MKQLKCAIVGCGGIAQVHGEVLHALETADLRAFADIRPERAQAMAERYGGNAYSSLEELLAREELDVLHICTPHVLHTPMAGLAAEKGIHVFSEKPPVINEEQWEEFRSLGEKVRVGVCFQNRYNPETQLLRRLLESGEFGAVRGARAFVTWHRDVPYYVESGWRGALATEGGGVLINQSIHTMDLLVYLLGRPTWVDASLANHHLKGVIEVEDTFEARIEFDGRPALFFATTGHCEDSPVLVEIVCENAVLRMEGGKLSIRRKDGSIEHRETPAPAAPTTGKAYWGAGHGACIADFYDSVLTGKAFPNDIPGITDTARLMLAAYRSARESHPTEL